MSDINVQSFSGKVNISNNLKVGSGHLFVDTQNNRVGLVTNAPDAGLHVNSNAYVHSDFRVGSGIVMNEKIATFGTTKTFVVTVVQVGGSNKFHIDTVDRPALTFHEHQTYIFDQSEGTNATHQIAFSEAANGVTPYSSGISSVGTPGQAGAKTRPTYSTPVGEICYCGDSPCIAVNGTDEINPNAPSYYSNQRFGLVPPDTPCNPCYNQFGSDSSFVNTALKEGLRRNELFTECSYPTMSRTIKIWGAVASEEDRYGGSGGLYDLSDEKYGASHYGFTPPTITVGDSLEVVELEVVSCVMEKLVNRIAEGGWEFIPSPTVNTLYFRKQKV